MNKIEELNKLKEKFDIKIKGLENYPLQEPNILIANHNCIMDIFFLPMSIPENVISFISSRLIYKNDYERQEMVEKYLYAMPVEAHGGKVYSKMCLDYATDVLMKYFSVAIFPEGAYVKDNKIYRGRTGATRILYSSRDKGLSANLIPVAIKIDKDNLDLDSYKIEGNTVEVTILPSINYEDYYYNFNESNNNEEKNKMLHEPIDNAFKKIANTLEKEYCNEYIELFPKKNVIFENGVVIPDFIAQNDNYVNLYNEQLENRKQKVLKRCMQNK